MASKLEAMLQPTSDGLHPHGIIEGPQQISFVTLYSLPSENTATVLLDLGGLVHPFC